MGAVLVFRGVVVNNLKGNQGPQALVSLHLLECYRVLEDFRSWYLAFRV